MDASNDMEKYIEFAFSFTYNNEFLDYFKYKNSNTFIRYIKLNEENNTLAEFNSNPLAFIIVNQPLCCLDIAIDFIKGYNHTPNFNCDICGEYNECICIENEEKQIKEMEDEKESDIYNLIKYVYTPKMTMSGKTSDSAHDIFNLDDNIMIKKIKNTKNKRSFIVELLIKHYPSKYSEMVDKWRNDNGV